MPETMNNENALRLPEVTLSNINYAFFTNENGQSDAGYLINDQKTRNVNIFSSEQKVGSGFDPADRVLANIQHCFEELGAQAGDGTHKFFMTSYYASRGEPLIISCDNVSDLEELKRQCAENLYHEDEDKTNPKRLGLEPNMRETIKSSDISIIRGDALIFKGMPDTQIAVLGASGDAHPIMMFDDENKIACYISGAHMTIKQGVLEKSFDRMLALGANPHNIRLVIGPGLGPKSYEFGANAPEYFEVPEALTPVTDTNGAQKYLVNIQKLVTGRLAGRVPPENIFDINLDTMGFDLYEQAEETLVRKTHVNFADLNASGPLFFSARRGIMEKSADLMEHNSAAYNTVGRHGAGFVVRSR